MKYYIIAVLQLLSIVNTVSGQSGNYNLNGQSIIVAILDSKKYLTLLFDESFTPYELKGYELDSINKIIKRVSDSLDFRITSTDIISNITDTLRHVFQLIPAKDANGIIICYINALCELKDNWSDTLLLLDDGGSCYYSFKIRLPDRVYYDILINGSG